METQITWSIRLKFRPFVKIIKQHIAEKSRRMYKGRKMTRRHANHERQGVSCLSQEA